MLDRIDMGCRVSGEKAVNADEFVTMSQIPDIVKPDSYVHNQYSASIEWVVNHQLNKTPVIQVFDSLNRQIFGDIIHDSINSSRILFNYAVAGKAVCN